MATNGIKVLGSGVGASVLSQAEYEALADLSSGYPTGILPRQKLNKTLRQSTLMSAVLAQLIVDGGTSVEDTMSVDALTLLLKNVIASSGASSALQADLASTDPMKGSQLVYGVGRVVATITELRSLPKTKTPRAFVIAYYSDMPGGGGAYRLDPADTTSVDNGGTVIVALDGGRWKLVHNNRIHVAQFGARGGGDDAASAIQACATALVALPGEKEMLLHGKWHVGSPIVFPTCSGVSVKGGDITHLGTFPTDRYTLEFNGTGPRSITLLHVDGVAVDCAFRGGAFKVDNGFKATLFRCHAAHFRTRGYWIRESSGAHEVFITHCWAMEFLYDDGEQAYIGPWFATGLDVEPNDCKVDGFVSYFTLRPLRVDSQYNSITNCHIGTGEILLTSNSSFTKFTDNYVDMGMLVVENPWHTKIQNNQFLHATSDTAAAFIRLKPLAAGTAVYGMEISGNSFQNNVAAVMHSMQVDTSSGTFSAAGVGQCFIERNSFVNTTNKTTRQRARLFQGVSTSYAVTADQFLFGAVQHISASFAPATAGVTVAQGVNAVGLVVTLTVSPPTSGVAHVEMDCNVE